MSSRAKKILSMVHQVLDVPDNIGLIDANNYKTQDIPVTDDGFMLTSLNYPVEVNEIPNENMALRRIHISIKWKMNLGYETLDKFCGSPFWNSTLTWNTDDPDFTKCFEKTVFVIIPIIFLWCFSPLEAYYLRKSPNRDIPWSWKNASKLFTIAIISVLCVCDFLLNLSNEVTLYKVNIYMPLLKTVTFGFAGILVYYNKKYGMQASGHQFLFWFLCAVCGAVQFRTEIRNVQRGETENYFYYLSYVIYYPLVLAMFLFNCFADDTPRIYPYGKVRNKFPFYSSSFLARVIYTFYDSLLFKGYKRPLEINDMWNLDYENEAKNLVPKFEEEFNRRLLKNKIEFMKQKKDGKGKGRPRTVSIMPVIFKCNWRPLVMGSFCRLVTTFTVFMNPQILSLLIAYVSSDEPRWEGYFYAFCLFAVGTFHSLIHNIHFTNLWYFGLRTRTSLMACIYRKALRISNATRKNKTVGEIVNLMAVDAEKFHEFAICLPLVWSAPIELIFAIYFLWQEVGAAILAGLVVMVLLIPVNTYVIRRTRTLEIQNMKYKDERIKMMNEVLSGIRVLKLYAWERSFEKIVEKIRLKEMRTLLKEAYLNAFMLFIWNSAPFIVSFVTFTTYVLIDENNVLDPSKAFVSLALLNILRLPLNMIPYVINVLVQTMVSVNRINSFLNSDELDPYVKHTTDEADPIIIENGAFSWGDDAILKNINLRVSKNSLTAIVGPVGCGKSSLINALLGEMNKTDGRVNTYGTIAYVSQQAWIQNATVRENIIFGKPFDQLRYNRVIEACALKPDLEMLADSDMTEIGEKGINLSGGQKQRVSLARAVYDNADIYLLDDPLSAVDAHVGKHIFTNIIGPTGLLNGKVRLLVTHAITYLPKTQNIFVIKDGEITESGSYQELLVKKGAFAEFLMQFIGEDIDDESVLNEIEEQIESTPVALEIKRKISRQRSRLSDSSVGLENSIGRSLSVESIKSFTKKNGSLTSKLSIQDEKFKKGKLIEIEKSERGNVKLSVYKYYLAAIGLPCIVMVILFYTGFQGFGISSNLWLGLWSEDPDMIVDGKVDTGLRNTYLLVYLALGVSQGVSIFAASVLFAKGTNSAAAKLHNILMHTVMRLPMQFFDVTPTGRILARFSSDIVGVDQRLPSNFDSFFFCCLKVLGTLIVICYATPIFAIVIIPVGALYIFIQRYFVSTSRQVKRLESVSRSPIYSHFGETIAGTTIIRAYNCQERFIDESEKRIDMNQMCIYPANFAFRWLGVRLEFIGNIIILASALFAVFNKDLNAATVGLSVSYALQITGTLNMLVRTTSDAETNIVSVERIKEYSETKRERPWDIPEKKPTTAWPDSGNVEFKNYAARYRLGLDLVLKEISFNVLGGEKVGIVGRTGAGKSSLTLSLFRIIEASEGNIFIDGVKISDIGLHDLRSKLTIIPQDAVLFSGPLRMNLDPFDIYSDEEIWKAVELAHLKTFISSLSAGLQHTVSEGGENLSVGQRQLICLARALLRKTKILVLDEATAAIDLETDDLIQKTIRTAFSDCTVLTIAHRLNTIIDSNRVIVLDRGKIVEFDTPASLLENKESIFFGMCKDAGLAS